MMGLEAIVNRTLDMEISIAKMRNENVLKMLDTFLIHGCYGINKKEAGVEVYPQYIDKTVYKKPFNHNKIIYEQTRKQGAIRLLSACWEWERHCYIGNDYYSTKIELIEKYFNHFVDEVNKIKREYITELAIPLNNWTDLIEGVYKEVSYDKESSTCKYDISFKEERVDILTKDTLYFLVTESYPTKIQVGQDIMETTFVKYSYKWLTLYLNLLNIAVGKPFLSILKIEKNGTVKSLAVPTMTDEQLKNYITLYNQTCMSMLKKGGLKRELINILDDEKFTKILKAKEEAYIDGGNFVVDDFFDEDRIIEDEICFDITEYIKEVMPKNEGWLGLTIEEWAKIADEEGVIVQKNGNIEQIKDEVSQFYIDFIQVLNKVLYLYGIFGVHYFLKTVTNSKKRFALYVGSSYQKMMFEMEYTMKNFNQQFIKF